MCLFSTMWELFSTAMLRRMWPSCQPMQHATRRSRSRSCPGRLVRTGSAVVRNPKDRMHRRDLTQVLVRRVGADAAKERPDFPGPLLQIRPENRRLFLIDELGGGELVNPAALS